MLGECRQVRIDGRQRAMTGFFGNGEIPLEIERPPVPIRILEDDVLERFQSIHVRVRTAEHARPPELGARLEAREDQFAGATILHRAHDDLRGFQLRGGQTIRTVGAAAREHGRVEAAARRILDKAILDTIELVAGIEHRLMNDSMLFLRDEAGLILQHRLSHPDAPGVEIAIFGLAAAPATMPSKSFGNRCAATRACRPPVEHPLKYERFASAP